MRAPVSRRFHAAWLLIFAATACAREVATVEVGRAAPSYAAVTLTGDTVSLAAMKGKPVLLNVWATWCAPCKEEIPFLEQLFARHRGAGLEIVGVTVDARGEEEKVTEFARDIGMSYALWHDPDQRVMSVFRSIGVPASYLIDRKGILRWRHLGVLREGNDSFRAALEEALRTDGEG
jgi:thiol-disulfide isomerase/thioredoxin